MVCLRTLDALESFSLKKLQCYLELIKDPDLITLLVMHRREKQYMGMSFATLEFL